MKQTGMELLRAVGYSCKNIQKIELCLICALLLTIDCTSVTDVASSQFGKFDFAELDEVLYDLEFSAHPVSEQDMEITSGVRMRRPESHIITRLCVPGPHITGKICPRSPFPIMARRP